MATSGPPALSHEPCPTCGLTAVQCPSCNERAVAGFRYCGHCGVGLDGAGPSAHSAAHALRVASDTATEQRRRVAILFADLTGSTALADRMEPEACYRVVSNCINGLGRQVTEAGGYVLKTLGDGLMALFGAPVAHGDDVERAAAAGLAMQAWMAEFSTKVQSEHGVLLRIRVGINYGTVVAAPMQVGERPQYDVLGDAVNVAQRLEASAEPGTVAVSETFYRLTRDRFSYEDRGTARVKGKAEPIRLFRLLTPRLESADGEALRQLPLMGRDEELASLREAAARLDRERESTLLFISGASGMGKTRLLEEMAAELSSQGTPVLRGSGDLTGRGSPLALWRGWLRDLLPLTSDQGYDEALTAVQEALAESEASQWAEWLTALAVDPRRLPSLDPEVRDRTAREALGAFLRHWQGEHRPAALLVDDAHLVDGPSMELLKRVGNDSPAPLLVLPAGETGSAFPPKEAQAVTLKPLTNEAIHALVAVTLPDANVPVGVLKRLTELVSGRPLFLDLALRGAREAVDPVAALGAVPDNVYGMIQAEVDRLTPIQRETAQVGSVLGRQFPERWLEQLAPEWEPSAPRPWSGLETRSILMEQVPDPKRELAFRHGALQQVLLESLLGEQRRNEHRRAATVIAREAATREELAGTVARHLLASDTPDEALPWLLTSGEWAQSLWSGQEASEQFTLALDIAERRGLVREQVRALHGLALLAMHHGEFAESRQLFGRARGIAPEGDESLEWAEVRGSLLWGEGRLNAKSGALAEASALLYEADQLLQRVDAEEPSTDYLRCMVERVHLLCDLGVLQQALEQGQEALRLAEERGRIREAAAAGAALGRVYPLLGDWPAAERELVRAAENAEVAKDWQGAAACWINLGAGLQTVGRFRDAEIATRKALGHAQNTGDAEHTAMVVMDLGRLHLNRGQWNEAAEDFQSAVERFRKMDHPLGVAAALYNLSDALRWSGDAEGSNQALEESQAALERAESPYLEVHLRVARAESALLRGEAEHALRNGEEALRLAQETAYDTGDHLARLAIGRAYGGLGRWSEAQCEIDIALKGFDETGEALEAARCRGELAAVARGLGDAAQADSLDRSAEEELRRLEALPWLKTIAPYERSTRIEPQPPRP